MVLWSCISKSATVVCVNRLPPDAVPTSAADGVQTLPERRGRTCRVAIVGAGAAGLAAAQRILPRLLSEGEGVGGGGGGEDDGGRKKEPMIVLEARDRVGGRIHTETVSVERVGVPTAGWGAGFADIHLDLGAAWVHGTGHDAPPGVGNGTVPGAGPLSLNPMVDLLRLTNANAPRRRGKGKRRLKRREGGEGRKSPGRRSRSPRRGTRVRLAARKSLDESQDSERAPLFLWRGRRRDNSGSGRPAPPTHGSVLLGSSPEPDVSLSREGRRPARGPDVGGEAGCERCFRDRGRGLREPCERGGGDGRCSFEDGQGGRKGGRRRPDRISRGVLSSPSDVLAPASAAQYSAHDVCR